MPLFLKTHRTILFLNSIALINIKEIGIVYKYSEKTPPSLLKIKPPLLENDTKTGRKISNEKIEILLLKK